MKKIFIYGLTYLTVTAATATGVKVFSSSKKGPDNSSTSVTEPSTPTPPAPPTPAQRFLSELLGAGNIEVDADISLKKQESALADIHFDGDLCLEDFSDIQVAGDLSIVSPFVDLDLSLAYLDSYVYAYNDVLDAKLETKDAITGISNLLTLFNVQLPTDALSGMVGNLSLDSILASFSSMTFALEDGYFKATLPIEGLTDVDLYVDADYRLHKVVIDELNMMGVSLSLSMDTNILGKGNKQVACPESETHPFDDFTSIFSFVENAYQISQQKQFAMHVEADLQKGEEPLTKIDARAHFDLAQEKAFALDLKLNLKDTLYAVTAQYQGSDIYFTLNDLFKGHLTGADITRIQQIIEDYTNTDTTSFVQKFIDDFMASEFMQKIKQYDFHALLDMFKHVTYDGNNMIVEADLSTFLGGTGLVKITLEQEENAIRALKLENISYQDYHGDVTLTLENYKGLPTIDTTEYEDYAPVFTIFDEAKRLSQEDQFAFQLNADVQNKDKHYHVECFVQFAFENIVDETTMETVPNNRAYVDLKIDDGTKEHQLVMEIEQNVMYFAYNNKLFGRMSIATLKEMVKQIEKLISSDDPLFSEIVNLIPSGDELSILGQIIAGNYQNVSLDLIKTFSVQPNQLNIVLSSALLNSKNDLDLTIGYNETSLTSLAIQNFQISTMTLSCSLGFATYDSTLALDKSKNYLDLNSLNLLLKFGITTMKQEYYTLQGKAVVDLASIYKLEIEMIVKLHNANGKVEAFISLPNIPLFNVAGYGNHLEGGLPDHQGKGYKTPSSLYDPSSNRSASIYIYDGYTIIYRTEEAHFHKHVANVPWPNQKVSETYIRAKKTTTGDFLHNIFHYLFSTVIGFNDKLMTIVKENLTMLSVDQMKFDELITGMEYKPDESRFSYDLNLAALTGNNSTESTNLSIYHANTNGIEHLSKIALSMVVKASILTINIDVNLDMIDFGSKFEEKFIYDFCKNYPYENGVEYFSHVA